MDFQLNIKCDNAAFQVKDDDASAAFTVAMLLQETAQKLESGKTDGALMDLNGNRVGSYELK